jgi:hypothetical protein
MIATFSAKVSTVLDPGFFATREVAWFRLPVMRRKYCFEAQFLAENIVAF